MLTPFFIIVYSFPFPLGLAIILYGDSLPHLNWLFSEKCWGLLWG